MQREVRRGKSILLLGPRQTGKTTLLSGLKPDLSVSLISVRDRLRYEKDPGILEDEVAALKVRKRLPLVIVDEVQKVPSLMDVAQSLIDQKKARLILTGSSARKLRRGGAVNLLPGRIVTLRLDPLVQEELGKEKVETSLAYGTLPGISTEARLGDRERDLRSYVETYLEEEVREEALVRNLGQFARFLELAALESGRITNFSKIAADVGISPLTIQSYYEILEDCLIAQRVDPITKSKTRKKLTKASRYLFFDLGVRRLACDEGAKTTPERMGELFEQFIGLELLRLCRLDAPSAKVRFWRDPDGPEVDWVLETMSQLIPIETKWSVKPSPRDARHLELFLDEYSGKVGVVFCQTPRPFRLSARVTAMPWSILNGAWLKSLVLRSTIRVP